MHIKYKDEEKTMIFHVIKYQVLKPAAVIIGANNEQ